MRAAPPRWPFDLRPRLSGRGAFLALIVTAAFAPLAGCGGTQGLGQGGCGVGCALSADFLDVADVEAVLSRGVSEARARGAQATLAVTDRVGNVLGVYQMSGADPGIDIRSGRNVRGGLEEAQLPTGRIPSAFAVISKAITAAYLSSEGNAFSTRTASQIVQENFNPQEFSQPAGPLYGVQFSQLPCSDVPNTEGMLGPRPAPLGFAADPGGLPLYKNGHLVGAVGVMSDSLYSLDLKVTDIDQDQDELIAVAAAGPFMAPADVRGDRITADGRSFRFTDSEDLRADPLAARALGEFDGEVIPVAGFFDGSIRAGVVFNTPESGFRADDGEFLDVGGYVVVDSANQNRFPPRAGTDGLLTRDEVASILKHALKVTNRTRAQVRRPQGSVAQATAVVVDTRGVILGLVRTVDSLLDATDVTTQKARTAAFFSNPMAASALLSVPPTEYAGSLEISSPGTYVERARQFFKDPGTFSNGIAYSTRALGNIHRPFFPDGVEGREAGPLSTPYENWSPFAVGLQLDLLNSAILGRAEGVGCAFLPEIWNGINIFGGGFPIYRGDQLVGGVGASGDGVEQDDMIAFLGLVNAGRELNSGIGHAPKALRADNLQPQGVGTGLRYSLCPQAPFLDSTEQNVCAGF